MKLKSTHHVVYKKFMRNNLDLHIFDLNIKTVELLDKEIIDLFQYSRNAFEMMGQAINEGILCGEFVINRVYFHKCAQAINKDSFPKTCAWFESVTGSTEYKYLTAFNNRTKHIGVIDTSYGFHLHDKVKTKASISSFSQEDLKNIFDILDKTIKFTINYFVKFLEVLKDECVDFNKVDLKKIERNKKQHNKKNNCKIHFNRKKTSKKIFNVNPAIPIYKLRIISHVIFQKKLLKN